MEPMSPMSATLQVGPLPTEPSGKPGARGRQVVHKTTFEQKDGFFPFMLRLVCAKKSCL